MRATTAIVLLGTLGALAACGSSRTDGFVPTPVQEKADAGGTTNEPVLGEGKSKPTVGVSLTGTVKAPNGTLPMANTLVYLTSEEPAPIPGGVYCDECVTLEKTVFATSAADGTFEINTDLPAGDAWVVVQKGQFRRVRKITVPEKGGELDVDADALTLPGKGQVSKGDTVPKMIVLKDSLDFDEIDSSLQKLGITDFEIRNDRKLLDDEAALMQYQIVFIPCGSQNDSHVTSETAKTNLQNFVNAGGKLYVTDWSYEFVRQPFPGYVSWVGETNTIGSAASSSVWQAPAAAADPGLGDWLAATGDTNFEVEGNYTTISAVNVMSGTDPKGEPKDIEPKVWVTATKGSGTFPTTVSFENQCGRVLFSTYHTEPGFGGSTTLHAQEKALLYVLLEVGVCIGGENGVQ